MTSLPNKFVEFLAFSSIVNVDSNKMGVFKSLKNALSHLGRHRLAALNPSRLKRHNLILVASYKYHKLEPLDTASM